MRARLALLESVERYTESAEILRLALLHSVAELGGLGGAVHLRGSPSTLRLAATAGLSPADVRAWERLGEEDEQAPAQAVRLGRRTWHPHHRFGHATGTAGGEGPPGAGLAVVPVLNGDRPVGALTVVTTARPSPEHWDFLCAVSAWVQERIRAAPWADGLRDGRSGSASRDVPDAGARTEGRASGTTDLSAALAGAYSCQDVVDALAHNVLPSVAGSSLFLLVNVVEDGRIHALGSRGVPGDVLHQVDGRPLLERDPVREAVVSGEPVFVRSMREYRTRYPELVHFAEATGAHAVVHLPLTATGHTFGVCVLGYERWDAALTQEETSLLTAVSALVAQALERARLYEAESTRSRALQRSLLPQSLPRLRECTLAARCLPAGRGAAVGGDWYDVIPLSAGRVAFVVGDVMGHGLSEAATMGRLRTAIRTLADLELPPDEIMSHLNGTMDDLGQEAYATCLYALYDSTDGRCSIVSAGHPPPAVVRPDGSVHFVGLDVDPPLCAADPPFRTTEVTVPAESLLVFYTDGLVRSAERPVDQGMSELTDLLRGAGRTDLDELGAHLVEGLLPPGGSRADDSVVLLARVHALAADRVASWPLPEDPQAAGQARGLVRRQLEAWQLEELTTTTELLVSELVGNVVRYATGPVRLRLLRGEELICEVSDSSLTMPRIRHAAETDEGGRGLQLVSALARSWGTRYTETGKSIWTAQPLPRPVAATGSAAGVGGNPRSG
ncbi:SpoIIE family protein phosphatase [Streptomyces althioticus]|jgi:GAF domain-containing protein/anti-sigma regulatory factor (Ser/Thr protein kinase)|uniref:SpoIIE family protein phosphatase n=1 Tax=Streptomyces althioticus group TaxID=2867194 RepID=UPI00177BFB59|nr:SpoIIE family protein phosphatase [Streptomyces althioticus]WTB96246.1 SpoIIE family protein phosphatase [Streptomyces althioticus]